MSTSSRWIPRAICLRLDRIDDGLGGAHLSTGPLMPFPIQIGSNRKAADGTSAQRRAGKVSDREDRSEVDGVRESETKPSLSPSDCARNGIGPSQQKNPTRRSREKNETDIYIIIMYSTSL